MLSALLWANVGKFLRFIRSGLGAIGLKGLGLGNLVLPGAGIIASLQNRIIKSLKQIPIIGELFKGGRKPFDPKTAKVAKACWLGKFFNALIVIEKGIKVFTDYNEMRDKGLTKFKSIAIALGKLAVDIGVYLAVVKGTAFALGKIGGLIGFAAGMLTGGPVGAALGSIAGAKIGAGLGSILGTIGYFFPGAIKAVTGGLVDVEKIKGQMQDGVENVISGAGSTNKKGVPPGKVPIKNKRGRTIGYKDAPKDESVVSADSTTITSASGFSVGEVVPFKTANNGDNLEMSSNVANVVDATVNSKSSSKSNFAGSTTNGGIDDTPDIESSNPNDNSTIVASAAFNIL